jgi:hypothetical protein
MTDVRKPDVPLTFVSVASYRDPELVPTITDCLAMARHPERLRFGICWQHGDGEQLPAWMRGEHFRVIDVDWRQSRGVCWARAEIMRQWDGEERYLQLDSHHRFAADWDVKLSRQLARVDSDLALLTTYAAAYTPGIDEPEPHVTRMGFDHFTPEGAILTRPWVLVDPPPDPIPAQFVSAHLLYAPGRFVEHVPYDPELYFIGEETTIALRAFTHGYDLFHPSEVVAWHAYDRDHRVAHWQDHAPGRGVARPWYELRRLGLHRYSRLIAQARAGGGGFGRERTFADYEAYAGISFRHRRVQDYTRCHHEPPNPPADPGWPTRVRDRRIEIALDIAALPRPALEDPTFWYVGVHAADGDELFRRDVSSLELGELLGGGDGRIRLIREFTSEAVPATWTVMPHSASRGWLEPIAGPA